MKLIFIVCTLISISVAANITLASNKNSALDAKIVKGLQSGEYAILLRHALAPGFSDPSHFDVNDCSTQRNLSAQGRQQAQRIGELLKANGVQQAVVFSSQWCRCVETARLLDLGEVSELLIANSFFQHPERSSEQTRLIREWLLKNKSLRNNKHLPPSILVTHQVNISALTDVFPSSGELVIIEVNQFGKIFVVAQVETEN
jgi:phosphohistidine phosphatase SixA